MLTPRYFFAEDFRLHIAQDAHRRFPGRQNLHSILSQPHVRRTFRRGDYLWAPGEPYEKLHYIISGTAVHFADHETGRRKIISFHGPGTVFPGYRNQDFKIELSLITVALSDMEVLEFTLPQFQQMFESNTALSEQVVNWHAMYINRLLFETVHQEYNSSFVKICNLLYLWIHIIMGKDDCIDEIVKALK